LTDFSGQLILCFFGCLVFIHMPLDQFKLGKQMVITL
jgi:hypothetical protein